MIDRGAGPDWNSKRFLYGVDGVLSHGPMRGPFAAHDADQIRLWFDLYFVIASKLLRGARAAGTDQRAGAGEAADDLIRTYGRRAIFVDVAQQIRDIVLRKVELIVDRHFLLGRSDQQAIEPWHGKEDAAVVGPGHQKCVAGGKHFERQYDVRALA